MPRVASYKGLEHLMGINLGHLPFQKGTCFKIAIRNKNRPLVSEHATCQNRGHFLRGWAFKFGG